MTAAQLAVTLKYAKEAAEYSLLWKANATEREKSHAVELFRYARGLQVSCERAIALLNQRTV